MNEVYQKLITKLSTYQKEYELHRSIQYMNTFKFSKMQLNIFNFDLIFPYTSLHTVQIYVERYNNS